MKLLLKVLSYLAVGVFAGGLGFLLSTRFKTSSATPPSIQKIVERPLEKYSFDALFQTSVPKGELKLEKVLKEEDEYTSYLFMHEFDPTLQNGKKKKVSGMLNLPKGEGPFPVVLMSRGYVDQSIFQTGVGTRRSAEEYAKAGFLTIAPDFLGYGESDSNAADVLESRFQAYTTALSVLASIENLPQWDRRNIFLWGHSNGGLITLTLLEVSGLSLPSVLWAPVSKPFPYSVLYYTDESADKGKFLRSEIADFESLYDAEKYSFDNHLSRITAPLQVHQGTGDDAVPIEWSSELVANLRRSRPEDTKKETIEYYTYPGGDHNLQPGWDQVVERNIEFFKKHMK